MCNSVGSKREREREREREVFECVWAHKSILCSPPPHTHTHTHTSSHPHQVTEEQIKLDLTDPSIMPTTNHYDKLITIATDPYEVVTKAHAMVVCAEWDEFITLDYHRIYQVMEKPAFVFDGRLILNHQKLLDIRFQEEAIRKFVMATATPISNGAH